MKNLDTLLTAMNYNDTITVKHLVGDVLGNKRNFEIRKYNETEDGSSYFSINKVGGYESYNLAGITRGALNCYTFDIFDNKIEVRVKIKNLELVAVNISEVVEVKA
jgi:hypothetical protein